MKGEKTSVLRFHDLLSFRYPGDNTYLGRKMYLEYLRIVSVREFKKNVLLERKKGILFSKFDTLTLCIL